MCIFRLSDCLCSKHFDIESAHAPLKGERVARLSACLCSKHFDNKSGSIFIVEKRKKEKEKEWENRLMIARVPSILISNRIIEKEEM